MSSIENRKKRPFWGILRNSFYIKVCIIHRTHPWKKAHFEKLQAYCLGCCNTWHRWGCFHELFSKFLTSPLLWSAYKVCFLINVLRLSFYLSLISIYTLLDQRRVQDPGKDLRWNFLWKYFHHICLTGP